MRNFILISIMFLGGCSAVMEKVPSFWDDNQSARIIDLRVDVSQLNCKNTKEASTGVDQIYRDLLWFDMYSESKGARQTDVRRLVAPMRQTVDEMKKRYADSTPSEVYCELKKKIMLEQSRRAAQAVLGRF